MWAGLALFSNGYVRVFEGRRGVTAVVQYAV